MINHALAEVSGCEIFNGISEESLNNLLTESSCSIKEYNKDTIIHFQGDKYKKLLLVLDGVVSSEISNSTGKRVKLENFHKSSVVAPGILFATDNTLPVTIIAESDCSLLSISKEAVISILQSDENCLNTYLRALGDKVAILADKIKMFQFRSIQQKIAGYLLNLSINQDKDNLVLPYTRENLADFFGVARPSLSRELSRMSEAGIIQIDGKKIKLLKKTALKYLLEGEVLD
ncbi:MAG: Crp/Fnr family transcriptional regulator [Spirochaetales bacterium]|nr:Crp/Fnr family transcriptional regulator [Spirochaetales bacterium]